MHHNLQIDNHISPKNSKIIIKHLIHCHNKKTHHKSIQIPIHIQLCMKATIKRILIQNNIWFSRVLQKKLHLK